MIYETWNAQEEPQDSPSPLLFDLHNIPNIERIFSSKCIDALNTTLTKNSNSAPRITPDMVRKVTEFQLRRYATYIACWTSQVLVNNAKSECVDLDYPGDAAIALNIHMIEDFCPQGEEMTRVEFKDTKMFKLVGCKMDIYDNLDMSSLVSIFNFTKLDISSSPADLCGALLEAKDMVDEVKLEHCAPEDAAVYDEAQDIMLNAPIQRIFNALTGLPESTELPELCQFLIGKPSPISDDNLAIAQDLNAEDMFSPSCYETLNAAMAENSDARRNFVDELTKFALEMPNGEVKVVALTTFACLYGVREMKKMEGACEGKEAGDQMVNLTSQFTREFCPESLSSISDIKMYKMVKCGFDLVDRLTETEHEPFMGMSNMTEFCGGISEMRELAKEAKEEVCSEDGAAALDEAFEYFRRMDILTLEGSGLGDKLPEACLNLIVQPKSLIEEPRPKRDDATR